MGGVESHSRGAMQKVIEFSFTLERAGGQGPSKERIRMDNLSKRVGDWLATERVDAAWKNRWKGEWLDADRWGETEFRRLAAAGRPLGLAWSGLAPFDRRAFDQALATGNVGRVGLPWLPEEAEQALGSELWERARPWYEWYLPRGDGPQPGAHARVSLALLVGRGTHWRPLVDNAELARKLAPEGVEVEVWDWLALDREEVAESDVSAIAVLAQEPEAWAWACGAVGGSRRFAFDPVGNSSALRTVLGAGLGRLGWTRSLRLREVANRLRAALSEPAELLGCEPERWSGEAMARVSWQARKGLCSALVDAASIFSCVMDGYLHGWRWVLGQRLWRNLRGQFGLDERLTDLRVLLGLAYGERSELEGVWSEVEDPARRERLLWRSLRFAAPLNDWGEWEDCSWRQRWIFEESIGLLERNVGARSSGMLAGFASVGAKAGPEALKGLDLSTPQWAALVIHAWVSEELASAELAWEGVERVALPDATSEAFPLASAAVLMGRGGEALFALVRLAREEEFFFLPRSPSHTRCSTLALCLAAAGRAEEAKVWWERALLEDASASARRGAWERALRLGKARE